MTPTSSAAAHFARFAKSDVVGVMIGSVDGRVVKISDRGLELLAYTREEVLSGCVSWHDLTPPEWHAADALVSRELGALCEREFTRKDGKCAKALVGGVRDQGDDGLVLLTMVDVTERSDAHAMRERLHEARATEERFRALLDTAPEIEVSLSPTISPVRDSFGEVISISKVARDVSQRKRTERELARAKEAAEVASRELEAFSYSVAHDLRAPLRGMNGFAQMLLDEYREKFDEQGQDWLHEIVLNANRMGALIDALLSLSRVTRSELRREPVNLSTLARLILSELAAQDSERNLALAVQDTLMAHADAALARTLLENLLRNAWKFTAKKPDGRITVGTCVQDSEPAFYVQDNGAGFDMSYARKLFTPFQRLHSAQEFPGTGIGLATVQRIVRRHGGRVWAEGTPERGATFYFTLPSEGAHA